MAQEIFPDSTPSLIDSKVRAFVYTDTDGSRRVDQPGLSKYLSEQFDYLEGTASYATPLDKHDRASAIAARLAESVDRENWQGDPSYPAPPASVNESARNRLAALRVALQSEVQQSEKLYAEWSWGLNVKLKNLFNLHVAPIFPAGIERLETTRAYIETFVTDRGEESQPSLPSALVTLDQNDSVTVLCNGAPSGRNITHRRLYRSETGTSGSAWRLQGEYPIGTNSITDSTKTEELEDDVCATFGWLEPPATLKGLTGLPNGIMVGYDGSTLYACEPYAPYAWPAKYDKPLGREITGLCALGQSVFVGTTGRPFLVTGADSASLSEELISSKVPCVSSASMVAIGNAVLYASPDGLAVYEGGRVEVVTSSILDRNAWQAYNPASMKAGEQDGIYMAFFTRTDASTGCLAFDFKSKALTEIEAAADAVFSNASGLFILDGTTIYDMAPEGTGNRTATVRSKVFRAGSPVGFCWLQVDADYPGTVTVKLYGDGVLFHTASVTGDAPLRLPAGRFDEWQVEIESSVRVNTLALASSTAELKALP